jgi:hypothetical protein
MSEISATWEANMGRSQSRASPGKKHETLSEKDPKPRGDRDNTPVVEHLGSMRP